ncbi:hypothetical protein IQ07DRAFT_618573 [Pyrenochaeta sp. DS3sAY3a]|nr:hypothetical protein IQ07DRAFT_618573 [Pyrenochaeta sp. DS3sAY3a]
MAARAGVSKRRVSLVPASASNNVPSLSFMEGLFGEEFPDAFASVSQVPKSHKSILDLPSELLDVICDHISKLDIKRLRLASKSLAVKVDLRIDRVYISPNRANLNALQRILEHPRYKHTVRELVWDDAQLEEYPTLDSFRSAVNVDEQTTMINIEKFIALINDDYEGGTPEYRALEEDDFFSEDGCLTDFAKGLLLRDDDQFSRDIIARHATLYQDEQHIMQQGRDVAGLRHALQNLPNLRRITLTSEVWRPWNLYPHYDTPYYRSLPPGFRKPSVWPWLGVRPRMTVAQRDHQDMVISQEYIDQLPEDWRGYKIMISTLLETQNSQIEEFIIDSGFEENGLNALFLVAPKPLLHQTIAAFRQLPLRRLQLSWFIEGNDVRFRGIAVSAQMKQLLTGLPHLEHLDFNPHFSRRRHQFSMSGVNFIPSDFLPDALMHQLKTFALRNAVIEVQVLRILITELRNAESITLDHCPFDGKYMSNLAEGAGWVIDERDKSLRRRVRA